MKKIIIGLCFIFVCGIANAELWVCQQGQTLRSFDGDGYAKGICEKNNQNIISQCIEATKQQYAEAKLQYKKLENGDVVDWTQVEIDVYFQAQSDTQRQALLDAIDKYEISKVDLITALVQVINVRIPKNPITKQEIIQQLKDDLGL